MTDMPKRKPQSRVEPQNEIHVGALPKGTVLRDSVGQIFECWDSSAAGQVWMTTGSPDRVRAADMKLPARVLFRPYYEVWDEE